MINKILQKHLHADGKYLGRNNYYPDVENPYNDQKCIHESDGLEKKLLEKYKKYIPKGWYGFSIGSPCPKCWFLIIESFLDYLITIDSNMEIHQIKLKFGTLLCYLHFSIKDEETLEFLELQVDKLQYTLHDNKLIF